MASATDKTVIVGPFDPNAINKQSDIIGPASLTKAGVMTAAQVQELADLAAEVAALSGTQPVDLFVDAVAGNNANDGSAAAPLQTFGAAWDKALATQFTRATINLVGSTPITLEPRGYSNSQRSVSGIPIAVVGSFAAQVSGTETVGDPAGQTFTDGSLAMTPDAFSGQAFVLCTGGANAGVRANVASNTATQVTVQGAFPNPIAIGDTFEVQLPNAFLDCSSVDVTVFGFGNGYIGWQGVQINLNGGFLIQTDVVPFTSDGLILNGAGGVFVTRKNSLYQGCNAGPFAGGPFNPNSFSGTLFKNLILVYGHGNVMMQNHMMLGVLGISGFAATMLQPDSLITKNSSVLISDNGVLNLGGGPHSKFDGSFVPGFFSPLAGQNNSLLNLFNFEVINAGPLAAVFAQDRTYLQLAQGSGATGNTGPGIAIDDTSQLNTNGSISITGSTPGVNDVNVAGTDKAYGALPYLEPNTIGYAK